jgi:hypothetical protein
MFWNPIANKPKTNPQSKQDKYVWKAKVLYGNIDKIAEKLIMKDEYFDAHLIYICIDI